MKDVKRIRERILTTQSRQKSYADQQRKPLEFKEGDYVFLKIIPTTGIGKAIRVRKLSPRYLGPFQILKQIWTSTYHIALPPNLSNLHNVFYVFQLRKYQSDPSHVLEPETIQLREGLNFNLPIVKILDKSTKQHRNKFVPLMKVA